MDRFKLIFTSILITITVIGAIIIFQQKNSTRYNNQLFPEFEPIPPPPIIDFNVTYHDKRVLKELFKGCNLTGDKKQLVNACNYTNSTVRNYSVRIAGQSEGDYNLGQICDIFDHFFNNWKYVNDPKSTDYIEYASSTIQNNFNGDCDDFAVLLCSSLLSIGGEARINYAYNSTSGHAFTEINLGKTDITKVNNYLRRRYKIKEKINGRQDKNQNWWLNLDWFSNYPGGPYFDFTQGTSFYILQNYCENF
jgi:hypothetical protein